MWVIREQFLKTTTGGIILSSNIILTKIPNAYKLYQNYPNPFNPITSIKFDLPKNGIIKLKVYDLFGKILYYVSEYKQAGTNKLTLDLSDYSSGLYLYRIEFGSYAETKKMVLLK